MTNTFSDFEYYLIPTFDFRHAILKESHDLEAHKPLSLREKIHEELIDTLKRYRQKE